MKETVVPNRNKIFSSIIQAVALSIANKTGQQCYIAMGIHAGDHAIYPDCRQEFRDADDHAFRVGNWGSEKVGYFTPYLEGDKFTILQDGETLCSELGLDFDEVYSRTNTSYKPIYHELAYVNNEDEIVEYSHWFSDYKSASSVERVEAFIKLGRKDPVGYADENGPVTEDVEFMAKRNGMLFLTAGLPVIKEASSSMQGTAFKEVPYQGNPSDLKSVRRCVYSAHDMLMRQC